jgi:hypothetical protein
VLFGFSILTYQYKAAATEHQKATNSNESHKQSAVTDFLSAWRMNQVEHLQMQKAVSRDDTGNKPIAICRVSCGCKGHMGTKKRQSS